MTQILVSTALIAAALAAAMRTAYRAGLHRGYFDGRIDESAAIKAAAHGELQVSIGVYTRTTHQQITEAINQKTADETLEHLASARQAQQEGGPQ